jgi:4-hydroxybenzoate polyprenyltransferase
MSVLHGFPALLQAADPNMPPVSGMWFYIFTIAKIMIIFLIYMVGVAMLTLAGIGIGAGAFYWAGVCVVALLLIYEHSLVRPADLSRLDAAFFTMNGVLSLTFFGFVLAGRVFAQ